MKEEFNLSEKIFWIDGGGSEGKHARRKQSYKPKPRILVKDVKEFIRRLKKVFNPQFEDDWAEKQIDKLIGDKLK